MICKLLFKHFFFVTGFVFLGTHLMGQEDFPRDAKPGKCYAKCEILNGEQDITMDVFAYLGGEDKRDGIATLYFESDESGALTWVDAPAKPSVRSLVHLQEVRVVQDTSQIKHYIIRSITFKRRIVGATGWEWREILCPEEVTKKQIRLLEKVMRKEDLIRRKDCDRTMNPKLKAAIREFQHMHQLPVGNLDMETMEKVRTLR